MRQLQIDREQSEITRPQPINETVANQRKSVDSHKEFKVFVISNKNSVDQYLMRHSDANIDRNVKERDTDNEDEGLSDRTKSVGKPIKPPREKKEEVQATLKPTPTSLPPRGPIDPFQSQSNAFPSENKSLPVSRGEDFTERMRIAREKQLQSRQSRELNQMFVVNRKLVEGQREVSVGGSKVYFPYEPYKVQVEYMEHVVQALRSSGNAVLESPTGTGKTLCLLASVLSFVEQQFRSEKVRHNVIYMSRTHSQLRQVQKELAKTCYRPNMAIFASREQLCLKESLAALRGKEKIEACGRGVKLARRLKKEAMRSSEEDAKAVEAACEFHKEREEVMAIGRRKLANALLDIEIMRQAGREEMFCPYFYPIQTKDFSTLFIMPYNYLLDEFMLKSYQELIENSIIIFDEAHNVSEAACEGRSLVLETHNLDSALLELNKILSRFLSPSLEGVRSRNEAEIKFLVQKIEDFKESFADFIELTFASREEDRFRRESSSEESEVRLISKERTDQALFELFCGAVGDERRRDFQQRQDFYKSVMMTKLILPIEEFTAYGVTLIEELKETPDGVYSNFERVLAFCLKIKMLLSPKIHKPTEKAWVEDELNHYRLFVNRGSGGFTVGLRCLVPWLTFRDILRLKPRSILLTSGTLKPLGMWEKELKVRFGSQLSNRHVISEQQIAARVIKSGPSKTRFTFTYDNLSKNRNEIYKDLIEFLIQAASRIPNGILLVFPSFKIQGEFKYELMRSPKKERLMAVKDVIFEEKSTDINMGDFKKKALSRKGAMLAIICRGKVSEGIDFPDGMCRAVFVVGVPYPNIKDPFIIEKKSHLESIASRSSDRSECITGEEWYFMGTVRAINQALGRVIRHAMDYGMVFLLDTRYCDNKMQKELPGWITQSMAMIDSLEGDFYGQIEEFYQGMRLKYRPQEGREEEEEQREEREGEKKVETNALKILMGNRKKMKMKRIPNAAFDF